MLRVGDRRVGIRTEACLKRPQRIIAWSPFFPDNSNRKMLAAATRRFAALQLSLSAQSCSFPCKTPCWQGICLETGAISTASPGRESSSNCDIPIGVAHIFRWTSLAGSSSNFPLMDWTDRPFCKFEMGAYPAIPWSVVGRCGTSCRSELSRVWGITLKRREGHEARFSQTSRYQVEIVRFTDPPLISASRTTMISVPAAPAGFEKDPS